MNPHEAHRQLAEIRERMARSQDFLGFAPLSVAACSALALLGAALQDVLTPTPMDDLEHYLLLWITVAAIGLLAGSLGVWSWARRTDTGLVREKAVLAIEQLAPAWAVGAMLTIFLVRGAPDAAWMLPGMWSSIFGLGVFALRSMLPREVLAVGMYYIAAGSICLSLGRGEDALAPWQMALCFGGGQLFGAMVLYRTVRRSDARS